jgi:hypothetical protein
MATSILDYIFRELAISYLDRGDLAHVQPGDLMPDTVGKGEAESNLIRRAASNGFVRNRLTVLDGGIGRATALAAFADPTWTAPLPTRQCDRGPPPRTHPRRPHQRLRRRQLRRMRQLHPDPQRHLPQMRYVWGTSGCS